jgi:alpha-L-arabinofuranosidase
MDFYFVELTLNNELYIDYDLPVTANAESYQVTSTDNTGDIIIKMVNVTGYPKTFAVDIAGAENIADTAQVSVAAGNSLNDDNILGKEEVVTIKESEVQGIGSKFNYTVPKYSATVLRIKTTVK